LLALLTSLGCESHQAEAQPSEVVARVGDCNVLQQRLCTMAGAKGPVCDAAKQLTSLLSETSCAQNLRDFGELQKRHVERRKPCDDLVAQVCEKTGAASTPCGTVKEQVSAVDIPECVKLLGRVDAVVENLKRQELAVSPLSVDAQAKIAAGGPSFGPENATVTLVEFSDFQCPYCAKSAKVTEQLRARYEDKVRFVFRNFPLPNHPRARPAALAASAAHAQGKFWQYHDLLFANQGHLENSDLLAFAKTAGLDVEKFRVDLDSPDSSGNLLEDQVVAASVAVQATPTLFLNGQRLADPTSFELVATEIDKALSKQ
jgi:protein-disulfide isomerase